MNTLQFPAGTRVDDGASLQQRLDRLVAENERLTGLFLAEEQRASDLMKLLLVLRRLHETTNREALLDALQDVIVNVIGTEELVILTKSADTPFEVVRTVGAAASGIACESGVQSGAASETLAELARRSEYATQMELTACVPLRSGSTIVGAVLIFALLEHKSILEPLDHELLEMLSVHAGVALAASNHSAETAA